MVSHFINEPEHWLARAEEARMLANQMNDAEAKSRCCGSLRNMSALLREPKAGPWGVYQIQTETLPTGGSCMRIETVLLIVILTFGLGFVLNGWDMRPPFRRRRAAVSRS
jgi:hypothetical protein